MVDMAYIDKYIKRQEYWKSYTGDVVKEVFIRMVKGGVNEGTAQALIEAMQGAFAGEYGE